MATSAMTIRPVTAADLDVLDATFNIGPYFVNLWSGCEAGHVVLLVAWEGPVPVGHVYLWDAAEPESPLHLLANDVVRTRLDGVPLLQGLQVLPEHRRGGVGSMLVDAIEQVARGRGHGRIALGVGNDNERARRLYDKVGYRDWQHGTVAIKYDLPFEGEPRTVTEHIQVMEKAL